MKDYYEILEVNKKASIDTIKKVFRMLIKKNHPDLFEGKEKELAEEKVKELNEAYEILTNDDSREKYNVELEEYNKQNESNIATLIEENEYLKSVIEEKNKLIKEFLDDVGVSNSEISGISDSEDDDVYERKVDISEGYSQYKREERIKKIIYMFFIIIVGMVVLWSVTGINMFKIFIDIVKTMF